MFIDNQLQGHALFRSFSVEIWEKCVSLLILHTRAYWYSTVILTFYLFRKCRGGNGCNIYSKTYFKKGAFLFMNHFGRFGFKDAIKFYKGKEIPQNVCWASKNAQKRSKVAQTKKVRCQKN
jgi:hypothetical protein